MPLRRWSLGVVPVLAAAAIACNAAALANEPEPSVAAPRSEVSCHDQFMIDRRDEPARALRDLQQCNTLRDVAGRMEYFTFWYITRPPAMRHKQDGMFGEAWKNNLGLLTGHVVSFRREQAIRVLDDSILRALKRGKRDDLAEKWLADHDPALLMLDPPGSASAQATPPRTTEPAVAVPSVTKTAVSIPLPEAPRAAPRAAEMPRRQTRRSNPRPALRFRNDDEYAASSEAQSLNRTQSEFGGYAAGRVAPMPYPTPPYYPVAPQPVAHPEQSQPPAAYLAPVGVSPVGRSAPPAQGVASAPPLAADVQQSRSAPSLQTLVQTVPVPFLPLALVGHRIETNIRIISGLIEGNFPTFEQVLLGSGAPPGRP
jgi:hypothetical protein